MQILIVYLGSFYVIFGIIFLLMPLIYIELGRPRDLIKAGLNLIIGMLVIVKYRVFDKLYSSILIFITILFTFYVIEIFSIRWNQLTDKEKNKLTTFMELKKNLYTFFEAISLLVSNFLNLFNIFKFDKNNENLIKKKWVKNDENGNILSSTKNKLVSLEMSKKTIQSRKDIIKEKKNN